MLLRGAELLNQVIPIYLVFLTFIFNVSVRPVVCPQFLDRHFIACNAMDDHDIMRQSHLAIEKYWVTHSGYFRLETTVALGMRITDEKIILCHGI